MARAGPLLVLCEEKIREKSGLALHRDLAELRSLSIPGTYQEKITHLGNSLMNLTGLKSLDLSRNSLVSLEGIQHLVALESLNLYYNCISSLVEVFRLHTLAELRDLDFRLNPVVKNESDYRLFVVHMLPKLRQLDDRPVRASEREASWLRFTSEETPDSTQSFPAVGGRLCHTRAKCTDPSVRKCSIVGVDDEAVLSLIAECEWDLSSPPGSMRSSQKEQEADFHSPQGSRHLSSQSVRDQSGDATEMGYEQRKGSSRRLGPEKWPQNQHRRGTLPQCRDQPEAHGPVGPHTHWLPHPDSTDIEDSTPSFQKSSSSTQTVLNPLPAAEKYRKRRVPSGRSQDCACHVDGVLSGQSSSEGNSQTAFSPSEVWDPGEQKLLSTQGAKAVSPQLHPAMPPGTQATLEVTLLEALLDLVDRYWSGCKSLHSNELFLAQARRVLSSLQELVATQDSSAAVNEEISYLTLENKSLQKHLAQQQQQHDVRMDELVSELNSTRKEMDGLRQHLDRCLGESSSLRSLLLSVKRESGADTAAALHVQVTGLQTGVQRLSDAVVELQQHLEHQDRTQELTHMLQESHSALVSTNEHLLQELGRARALHRAEVDQLHWSYKALKKTLGQSPNGSARPPCTP